MVSERDVEHIAGLADVGIIKEELEEFTHQFNRILDYFDILDQIPAGGGLLQDRSNVFREDRVSPSLSQEDALKNAGESEDGFFKAPRVM
jgi:aspartyl-tRNA(Asn)/glutamyl-tRNA(Gln) amidotransferase subunit C